MDTDGPKLTGLGKFIILLLIAGSFYGAYLYFVKGKISLPAITGGRLGGGVQIGVAYGTEKERWLQWAVEEFAKTSEGRGITVTLIPMGSLEAAHAIEQKDNRINVWSPASTLYTDAFVQEWQTNNNTNPILKDEKLALTPMVFIMWEDRYQPFVKKYGAVTFATIAKALQEKSGWSAIAGKPDWGVFKFGHTYPNQSNSGLMTLVLMAYEMQNKSKALSMSDILSDSFQHRLQNMESAVSGLQNSTGTLMRDMVLKGPSSYDAVCVYENVAIDYLKNAEGRWGKLHVAYPAKNMWNEHPYYILDVPWSTPAQRKAAEAFQTFLMSEPAQKMALVHGFRPGDPNVPVRFPESPFVRYASYGLKIDISTICDTPKAEVVNNLLASWQRTQAGR